MALAVLVLSLLVQNSVAPGTIAGHVFMPDGKPAANVRVAIQPETRPDGMKAGLTLTQTDSSGAYRLTEVQPGRYYVMIGSVTTPVYHPGTASRAEATLVSVTAGVEATVDFRNSLERSLHVRGRIVPAPPQGAVLQLTMPAGLAAVGQTLVAADGSFIFPGMSPGSYLMLIRREPWELRRSLGSLRLETNLNDLLIVNGRVTIKDGTSIASAAELMVEVTRTVPDPATPIALRFPVGTDGSFSLMLQDGDHTIRLNNRDVRYEVESIVSGTTNLLAEPLKTASPDLSEVSISLRMVPPR
jgi:hypothetical protein